jgi:hypothetical protein
MEISKLTNEIDRAMRKLHSLQVDLESIRGSIAGTPGLAQRLYCVSMDVKYQRTTAVLVSAVSAFHAEKQVLDHPLIRVMYKSRPNTEAHLADAWELEQVPTLEVLVGVLPDQGTEPPDAGPEQGQPCKNPDPQSA